MSLRNILFTTLGTLILLTTSSNIAYASESTTCEACTTTSPYIDNYIDFVYEIIATFQTYANRQNSALQQQGQTLVTNGVNQVNTNSGSNWVQSDINRSLQSIVDNLNNKAQTVASSAYVFSLLTTEAAILDSWKSLNIMFHSQSLMRDWQKIDTMGQLISNTLLDLGNAGVFVRLGFREGRDARIIEILNRYSTMENAPILYKGGEKLASQPTDVLGALWRMNQAIKTTLSVGGSDLQNKFLDETLFFSDAAQTDLPGYYKCTRSVSGAFSCSSVGRRAKDNLENTRQDAKKDATSAKKKITDAIKRLSGFRSSNDATKALFKQRQNELLVAEYGLSAFNGGPQNAFGLKSAWKTLKNDTTTIGPFAGLNQVNTNKAGEPFVITDQSTKYINEKSNDNLETSYVSVLTSARRNRKESMYSDSSSITMIIPTISKNIAQARSVIESKPDAPSIIQNLGKACDLQCRNLGGKCRYQ